MLTNLQSAFRTAFRLGLFNASFSEVKSVPTTAAFIFWAITFSTAVLALKAFGLSNFGFHLAVEKNFSLLDMVFFALGTALLPVFIVLFLFAFQLRNKHKEADQCWSTASMYTIFFSTHWMVLLFIVLFHAAGFPSFAILGLGWFAIAIAKVAKESWAERWSEALLLVGVAILVSLMAKYAMIGIEI